MYGKYRLLNVNDNAKTRKGDGQHTGYLTGILYMAPADLSGYNVCQFATAGCKAACLNTAGRGGMTSVQIARVRKTVRFFTQREAFMGDLAHDIRTLQRHAAKHNLRPVVRLNGTSDLPWERVAARVPTHKYRGVTTIGANYPSLLEAFPDVQFYDYTKDFRRMVSFLAGDLPQNYDLTFSYSGENIAECETVLQHGGRVAVVFGTPYPYTHWTPFGMNLEPWQYRGPMWPVVTGDGNDLRFMDPRNVIVALKAKGRAKRDKSGFVVWHTTCRRCEDVQAPQGTCVVCREFGRIA